MLRPLLIWLPLLAALYWGPVTRLLAVGVLLLAGTVSYVIMRARYQERVSRQSEVDRLATDVFEQLESGRKPRYILFLRPFSADPVVRKKLMRPGWRLRNIFDVFDDPDVSLNEVIYKSVGKIRPDISLIALRGHRESGMGENHSPMEEWQDFVLRAAEGASLDLVLLGAGDGLMIELEQLGRKKLFQKTVFIMPPISSNPVAYLVRNRGIVDEEASDLHRTLRELGLNVPLPTADGQVIYFGRNTSPKCAEWTWDGRALARMVGSALHESAGAIP